MEKEQKVVAEVNETSLNVEAVAEDEGRPGDVCLLACWLLSALFAVR